MDPLSDLLSGIRTNGAAVGQCVLTPPWALRFIDRSPLTLLTILEGSGTVILDSGLSMRLGRGKTAIVKSDAQFSFTDDGSADSNQRTEFEVSCLTNRFREIGVSSDDVPTAGESLIFVGTFQATGRRHERIVNALPDIAIVQENESVCTMLREVVSGITEQKSGAQAVVDRFLDWGLVCSLRTWFDSQKHQAPNWYQGVNDPVVGPVLEAIHQSPGDSWTVEKLAAKAGYSRAFTAKRFTQVMGQPPLTYLTEWRMDLAQDLFEEPAITVAEVARRVGYSDAFGFSTAFKRHHGSSPSAFRAAV